MDDWILGRRARGDDLSLQVERAGCCRASRDARPAERAVGVVLEPNVDAVDVEHVATVGDYPQLLFLLELIQADRALAVAPLVEISALFSLVLVPKDRDRSDYRLVEPPRLLLWGMEQELVVASVPPGERKSAQ